MTQLTWDGVGERFYETGVDRGVLYIPNTGGAYNTGFAWNGLVAIVEKPTGAAANPKYADNIKYLNLVSVEQFGAQLDAHTYPDEFGQCDGTIEPVSGVAIGQQHRKSFGLSFRTRIGNDIDGTDLGYKLHLIYGALASPSDKQHNSINDQPDAITFSWAITTTAVNVTGYKPTAQLVIDSTKVDAEALADLEELLYGTVGVDPQLPTPEAVLAIFSGTITTVTPVAPTYVLGTHTITIPTVTGVIYEVLGAVVTGTVVIGQDTVVTAAPALGYAFPLVTDDDWFFSFT